MQVIVPVPFVLDTSGGTGTTVPAPDASDGEVAWVSGGSYARFDRVYRSTTRLIYECRVALVADTVTPEQWVLDFARYEGVEGAYASQERWRVWGPCNADKMFDQAVGTVTLGDSPLVVELLPSSLVDSIYLGDVNAATAQIEVLDGATVVYDTTVDLSDYGDISDWFEYFFDETVRRSEVVLTDLPPVTGAMVRVTLTDAADVGIGTCQLGRLITFGDTQWSPTISSNDYSTKTVSAATGATVITPGPSSKRMEAKVVCDSSEVDVLVRTLTRLQSIPSVWIGAPGQFESMTVFGYPKTWSMDIAYTNKSYLSVNIEGLT